MNEVEPFSMRLDHGIIPEVSRNNPGLLQAEELVDFSDGEIRDSDKLNNRHQPRPKIAVCRYASDHGRTIALEPVNRFETDFINTCEQGLQMIHDVGSPALKLHLDTFHMNIEEKDPAAAIRKAGGLLGHFHACGCDCGTPGNDHIDWKSIPCPKAG